MVAMVNLVVVNRVKEAEMEIKVIPVDRERVTVQMATAGAAMESLSLIAMLRLQSLHLKKKSNQTMVATFNSRYFA